MRRAAEYLPRTQVEVVDIYRVTDFQPVRSLLADVNLIGCVLNDRFNPKLKDELLREVRRIQKRFPKISRWLTEKIQGQRLLALDV